MIMPMSVVLDKLVWDVMVPRNHPVPLAPVWLRRQHARFLLCQVSHSERFGWSVVVRRRGHEVRRRRPKL